MIIDNKKHCFLIYILTFLDKNREQGKKLQKERKNAGTMRKYKLRPSLEVASGGNVGHV